MINALGPVFSHLGSRTRAALVAASVLSASLLVTSSDARAASCACSADAVDYAADALPDSASPAWTPYVWGAATSVSVSSGILHLDTTADVTAAARFDREWDVTNAEGVTVEARVKLNDYVGNEDLGGAAIWVEDDVNAEVLIIEPDGIRLYGSHLAFAIPTDDGFHTYRITAKGNDIFVYVDGALAIDGTGHFGDNWWTTRHKIAFGDGSLGAGSDASWDYVRYSRCVWDVEYSADNHPAAEDPAWTASESAASIVSVSGGVLRLDTLGNVALGARYDQPWSMDLQQGASVEARMRLDAYSGNTGLGGAALWIESSTSSDVLIIRPTGIKLYGSGLSRNFSTTDRYHTYCVDAQDDDIMVYVDGQLAIDGAGQFKVRSWGNGSDRVSFGDGSAGAGSRSFWDYVRYSF